MTESVTLDTTKRRKKFLLVSNSGCFDVELPQDTTGIIQIDIDQPEGEPLTIQASQNGQPIEATFTQREALAQ